MQEQEKDWIILTLIFGKQAVRTRGGSNWLRITSNGISNVEIWFLLPL